MDQRSNVLIVEDDAGIRQSLFETLTALRFVVGEADNGEEALMRLRMIDYDAVLLDINMPGMGGIETCRRIHHSYPHIPIIMLTVRDEEDDKVEALDAGADDYVTKPFQIRELTARLRSIIRRSKTSGVPSDSPIVVGSLMLDPDRRRVEKMGQEVHLTPKEFEMLRYLMEHAGRPVPHSRLLIAIWGLQYGNEREYLRVLINQLRKKIEDDPAHPTYILTDSYIGYRFREA
ncbi:response regulator transcription factor [Edaphobacter modestus]|uniref:Two-component system KDP operon response regulator KdpE n=1 Tax=Edaphobacter modestus TaxID=388466 RepID=A0A4Q7YYW3_9BACT|nr:response regulator transcription factor [Edaphobacter modestus]RZU43087.1 two-component system KDP operon response regulator KdpE [Edaphobacter modestus]